MVAAELKRDNHVWDPSPIGYMKALTFSRFGTAEVLEYIDVPIPSLGKNEVKIKMIAIGLSYDDIYTRKGNYTLKGTPPYIAGYEGSGVVVESKCTNIAVGTNVAFTDVPFSNADFVIVPLANVILLPDDIDHAMRAYILQQGLTAHYLCTDSYPIRSSDPHRTVLIHAAAGGVGKLLT